jgi:hypothetical protein
MIKNQSQCPYCNACVVAYDWDADKKIIFNPDRAKPDPCEHLAYVGVYCLTYGQLHSRHTVWLHPAADPSLAEYLRSIGVGTETPDASYEISEAEHEHRHQGGTDAVTFFGIYSPDPKGFLWACLDGMSKGRHG